MTWNYRVIRKRHHFPGQPDHEELGIHEVYYDEDGNPASVTMDSMKPSGNTLEELAADLRYMVAALNKPILEYDMFVSPNKDVNHE